MKRAFLEMADMAKLANPPKGMNATEREFAWILEAQKREGKILRYEFEGISVQWGADPKTGKQMRYTPDFVVLKVDWEHGLKFIEVKGAHIWDRDIVRFKGARSYWPEFQFEMWQKTRAGWKQKY